MITWQEYMQEGELKTMTPKHKNPNTHVATCQIVLFSNKTRNERAKTLTMRDNFSDFSFSTAEVLNIYNSCIFVRIILQIRTKLAYIF